MKKIKYEDILDITKLLDVYFLIKKKTKNKSKLVKYSLFLSSNLFNILFKLQNNLYNHGKYHVFKIMEPKTRIILSEDMDDKIVNHLVSKYILSPIIEPRLIDSNIATRKGKGTSYGIKLLKKYINDLKYKYDNIYILKCDIKKYFFNIDHEILLKKLNNIIDDVRIMNLLKNIIESTNYSYINSNIEQLNCSERYEIGKGLPIGNMSSQILAIFYLNDLDHYIKEKLKIKCYIRYMDDLVLIHHDKEYLNICLKEIERILNDSKLCLNHKTNIYNGRYGFNFLGYRFKLKGYKLIIKMISKNKYKIKRKLKDLKKHDVERYQKVLDSYYGYAKVSCEKRFFEN